MKESFSLKFNLWLCLLLLFAASCTERTENDLGVIMLPTDAAGSLPARLEMRRALEGVSIQGELTGKGNQSIVYVGRTKQYELRTLLDFRLDLPEELELVAANVQFYVIRAGGEGEEPITLSMYKLTEDFTEGEATWEQAAVGRPWMTPGGDYLSDSLGSAVFQGGDYDTVSVNLDLGTLEAHLAGPDRAQLPLVVLSEQEDVFVKLLAREAAPESPVASRLNVIFTTTGSTEQLLLERRPLKDATIANYQGQLNPDRLMVGEIPAGQVFFSYDFSELPAEATMHQALLHLSVSGGAVVDTFLFTAFAANQAEYVEVEGDLLSISQGGASESDSTLVLDITLTIQLMLLQARFSEAPGYLGLAGYRAAVPAGFLEFYSETWPDSLLRPYLIMIYSDPSEAPLPY